MSGRRPTGVQLPSTNELATLWKSSPYTVHTALTTLVKEGWLERLNGAGTYVVDPGKRFVRAGIYHAVDICSNEHPAFVRNVHTALLEQFKRMDKETQVFIDTRPLEKQTQLLPTLEKAILERSIQCLVAPSLSPFSAPEITKLKIPTSYLGNPSGRRQINSNMQDFFARSVRRLAEQGCRSVGLICTIHPPSHSEGYAYYERFNEAIRNEGLTTRPEWIRSPSHYLTDSKYEGHGYSEFLRLWQLAEKPDGLVLYPDALVRGMVTAVLETGIQVVPPQMKFVFHRNQHIAQFCPFAATWAMTDETEWAAALIRIIEKQFAGEKVSPFLLPFLLEENVPPAR